MSELHTFLKEGAVAFYGYRGTKLPDVVHKKTKGTTRMYSKDAEQQQSSSDGIGVLSYANLSEMREKQTDVFFLDHEAVKVFFAKFPVTSRYLLVRLVPRMSWLVAIPGLIRRLVIGLVRIEGVVTFRVGGKKQRWLAIEHLLSESLQTRYSISEEVGVQGLLDHLRDEDIEYVVLRFYERLPRVYREGGDVDILVSDADEAKLRSFLQQHPGKLGVDVWTPSRVSHNSITYYPPPLARKIIASAIEGPAGARIPSPKEAFIGFAYHCLYHKGPFAGVLSSLSGVAVNQRPENDYSAVLKRMAEAAGIDVEITMEALDEYLAKEGWRPKTDTLAKMAPWNAWVEKRFFSSESTQEVGLGVFIIKKRAFRDGVAESVLAALREREGFTILRTKTFTDEEVHHVTDHLRGGVWNDISGAVDDFLPAMAVIVLNTRLARMAHVWAKHAQSDKDITDMKKYLRKAFDTASVSSVHSTDTTHEAWEYIEECFPNEKGVIERAVDEVLREIHLSSRERIKLFIFAIPHTIGFYYARYKRKFLGQVVRWLVG